MFRVRWTLSDINPSNNASRGKPLYSAIRNGIIAALSSWPLTWSRKGESSQGILGVPRSAELGAAGSNIGADMFMDPDREDLSPATWGRVLIRPAPSEYLADCRQRKAALFKEERKLDEERHLAAQAGGEK